MADEQATCPSCGERIIWITDQSGTRLPLNKLRVRVYGQEASQGSKSGEWGYADEDGKPMLVHISHFLTCPNASRHSKGRPRVPPNRTERTPG